MNSAVYRGLLPWGGGGGGGGLYTGYNELELLINGCERERDCSRSELVIIFEKY